ncbi:MAG: alkylhalidase [Blastopirellula sp.]|nr:MAG: alkylhalidase [Blastopirellula sp.]
MKSNYDCIVVGGGPAGSSTATILAQAGCDALLLEREKFPRFHVGESLMPEVYWPLERLGMLDKMKQSNFVKKVSVQFVTNTGKQSSPFFFKMHDPRESSQTWQVERAEFDQMLFDNAKEHGADCFDETRVLNVLMDGEQAVGVTVKTATGETKEIRARVVVDATGQSTVIANQLRIKEDDPDLQKIAVWTYYKNAARDEGENGGATIIMHTEKKDSWFWFIPLSNNITSIGVVGDRDYILQNQRTPEKIYEDELSICPGLQQRLMDAERVEKHHVAKEFSYKTTQHSGPGWVLTGDAFGFIDPIYSSGVYFALVSGEKAADCIVEGLKNNDLSAEQLGSWTGDFKGGSNLVRKLVDAFYNDSFSFGKFMKTHPQHVGSLTDLLIGRIFHESAGNIFDDMDPWLAEVQEKMKAMSNKSDA